MVQAVRSAVEPNQVLRTGRYDAEAMAGSARWQMELEEAAATEQEAVQRTAGAEDVAVRQPAGEEATYGIRSCVLEATRPFHPARLWALLWGDQRGPGHEGGHRPPGGVGDRPPPGGAASDQPRGAPGEGTEGHLATGGGSGSGPQQQQGWIRGQTSGATLRGNGLPALGGNGLPAGILRSKGFFWVAGLPQVRVTSSLFWVRACIR